MNSIQPQNYGLNLSTILPLQVTFILLMLIFAEIIYFLRYNTLITENGDA